MGLNRKISDWFIFSAAVILFITAAAKIFASFGTADALNTADPLLPLSNRNVFLLAGLIELALSAFLLVQDGNQRMKLSLTAWLATNYLVYRIGVWWIGAPTFCDCLGNLNSELSISPRVIYPVMLAVLVWLLAGSYGFLAFDWLTRRKPSHFNRTPLAKKNGAKI